VDVTPVTILGSTGSVGTQALDVIRMTPGRFRVHALAANTDASAVAAQAAAFGVSRAAMADREAAKRLRELSPSLEVLDGPDGVEELARDDETHVVLNAVVGAAGLRATLAALDAGRRLALANKESCVAGGPLVARRLRAGAVCVPVDSEHAATHMCLAGEPWDGVRRLVLTASGGPFRGRGAAELADVTPAQALEHPTWDMGAKVTIDSATLMNKGLEVIEARVLFGFEYDAIDVVCHPQSVVHCLVEFADGSWKASLAPPDMRVPIAYALGHPRRPDWGATHVDWSDMGPLTFEPVDTKTFRCVNLAYAAGRAGGTAPAVLNAANEVAVLAFLDGALSFNGIADVVDEVLGAGADAALGYGSERLELDDVLAADEWARSRTRAVIDR
jgi:1-deoxy-D-xylulose-5-phosphate reductoisomerase